MSSEIIIIIVGALLILLSFLGLSKTKLQIPVGILGVLLIIYGGFTYGNINMNYQSQIETAAIGKTLKVEYPIKNIQVTSPVKGDAVKCRILTMGVYPESNDKDIWVLLKPTDNRFYPQSDHTNTSYKRNGEWQVITRFGGDKDEKYEVIVYEADKSASNFFSTTILKWKEANDYPGLNTEDIPSGAVEVDRINVSLADNCRGVN